MNRRPGFFQRLRQWKISGNPSPIWPKFTLLAIAVSFAGGIIFGDAFTFSPLWSWGAALLLLFLPGILKSGRWTFILTILLVFFFLGITRWSLYRSRNLEETWLPLLPLKQVTISGTVDRFDKREVSRAVLNLTALRAGGRDFPVRGKVLVYFSRFFRPNISPAQFLTVIGVNLVRPPGLRNPGQFDYANYLYRRGIVAQCRVKEANQLAGNSPKTPFGINRLFKRARETLQGQITAHFPPETAGFLTALLLGNRALLDKGIQNDFQNAGVIHVLAISGLHVGFVALIIGGLLALFPIYFKRRNYLLAVFLLLYMKLTGGAPPVQRATIMAIIVLAGINLERRYQIYNGIGAAALLILALHPQQLFWVGFQISFAAVLSIVFFTRKIERLFDPLTQKIADPVVRRFAAKWIFLPLAVSAAAQLGTLPLIAFYFHKISLVAFFLNLIVIPYIGVLVGAGLLFLAISLISNAVAVWVAVRLGQCVHWLILLVHLSAHLPYAYLPAPAVSRLLIFAYFSLLLALFFRKRQSVRYIFLWTALLLLSWKALTGWNTGPELNLIALDVGQGDATLIQTAAHKIILIDDGPATAHSSAADYAIKPALDRLGARRIDYLFITHPHLDHLGGTFRLLVHTPVDSVFLPPFAASYFWMDSLRRALKTFHIPTRVLKRGDVLAAGPRTRIYVLAPSEPFPPGMSFTGVHLNNHSLVLLLREGSHGLLIMGDAEKAEESRVIRWGRLLRSDYLKVGHHGGKTSTGMALLNLVKPDFATISVGAHNKYGHPSRQALERLRRAVAHVYRTDRDRAVWLQLRGDRWRNIKWR